MNKLKEMAIEFVDSLDRSALGERAVNRDVLIAIATSTLAIERYNRYFQFVRGNRKTLTTRKTRSGRERMRITKENQNDTLAKYKQVGKDLYTDFQKLAIQKGSDSYQAKAEYMMWRRRRDYSYEGFGEQWTRDEAERLSKMVDHPKLYHYFIAGIWDVEAAYRFMAQGIDPNIAVAVTND